MANDALFYALEKIDRLNKAILTLKNFGIEESVESYLLSFPNRTKAQAFRYAHRQIDPQIKFLQKELDRAKLFVKLYREFLPSKTSSISYTTEKEYYNNNINAEIINVI